MIAGRQAACRHVAQKATPGDSETGASRERRLRDRAWAALGVTPCVGAVSAWGLVPYVGAPALVVGATAS